MSTRQRRGYPVSFKKSLDTTDFANCYATAAGYSDDFAVSGDGTGFVAGGSENAILRLSADGQQQTIAGDLNSTLIAEPTAVALQESDEGFNLFVTTAGGEAAPVDGTEIVGAQLLLVSVPLSEGSAQRM